MRGVGVRHTTFSAMGTTVTIVVGAGEPTDGMGAVRDLFRSWEAALSRFRRDSELTRLNAAAGRAVTVSPLLMYVTRTALDAAAATAGAFDPTLGHQIAGFGYGPPPTATGAAISEAWRHVACDTHRGTVTLPPGAALDLGGIAKGMAVDASAQLLRSHGVTVGLVCAGGDMRTVADGVADWQVSFDDAPDERVTLHSGALATSSRTRRRWIHDGRPVHHLLDPRTGAPVDHGLVAVSVAAATCTQAEVAAKAAFVLGPDRAVAFLERHRLAGLLVHQNGRITGSSSWPVREPTGLAA